MTKTKLLLLSLCFLINCVAHAKPAAVIFDLDDTLFDVSCRKAEVSHQLGVQWRLPRLAALRLEETDYFCAGSLKNAGIEEASLVNRICGDEKGDGWKTSPWGRLFLSGSFLKYDCLLPGSVEFVNRVTRKTGAILIYLTARTQETQEADTWRELEYHSFPVEKEKALLVTRPSGASGSDAEFKRGLVRSLATRFELIGAFDDSRSNANMLRQELPPDAPVVRPVRDVSERTGVSDGVEQITNYYFNSGGSSAEASANASQLESILRRLRQMPCDTAKAEDL